MAATHERSLLFGLSSWRFTPAFINARTIRSNMSYVDRRRSHAVEPHRFVDREPLGRTCWLKLRFINGVVTTPERHVASPDWTAAPLTRSITRELSSLSVAFLHAVLWRFKPPHFAVGRSPASAGRVVCHRTRVPPPASPEWSSARLPVFGSSNSAPCRERPPSRNTQCEELTAAELSSPRSTTAVETKRR